MFVSCHVRVFQSTHTLTGAISEVQMTAAGFEPTIT